MLFFIETLMSDCAEKSSIISDSVPFSPTKIAAKSFSPAQTAESILEDHAIEIDSLDLENAAGVGRTVDAQGVSAKVIFVEGALPGERVTYTSYRKKPTFEKARVDKILRASTSRVTPRCPFFGICGGCAMQHIDAQAQVAMKQRALEDKLWHLGKLRPQTLLRPQQGPTWGYRARARLAVRHVPKKGGVLVGFHERGRGFVADMTSCDILPPFVSALLVPLRRLIERLSIRDKLPQIELAVGEPATVVLVLRILEAPNLADVLELDAFAQQHKVQFWAQPKGPDSAIPWTEYKKTLFLESISLEEGGQACAQISEQISESIQDELAYTLPEFNIRMPFKPTDFTQVNIAINRAMVHRAVRLLNPQAHEKVLDLFCGLGNFTLPLARYAKSVLGIEGSAALTQRAFENAQYNGLSTRTAFTCRNLFELTTEELLKLGSFDKWLIDPPRDGALAVVTALAACKNLSENARRAMPKRIVYVSCNPATLARDAGLLVHEAGYVLQQAGVINMFPHTCHVESIAVFEQEEVTEER